MATVNEVREYNRMQRFEGMTIPPAIMSGFPNTNKAHEATAYYPFNTPFKSFGTPIPDLKYDNLTRFSSRCIVANGDGQILLICVGEGPGSYYKFPGGGLEPGETFMQAAKREVKEETGCVVKIEDEARFATSQEWRDASAGKVQTQISACYRAELVDDSGKANLTQEEKDDGGFRNEWVSVSDAMDKLETCKPPNAFGKMVVQRELFFLEEYGKNVLGKTSDLPSSPI